MQNKVWAFGRPWPLIAPLGEGRRGYVAWLAGILLAATGSAAGVTPLLGEPALNVVSGIVILAFATAGAVIAVRVPSNAIGWVFLVGSLLWAVGALSLEYALHVLLKSGHPAPATAWLAVSGAWARAVGWSLMVNGLLLLFPDGRVPSPRWRPAGWAAGAVLGLWTLVALVAPRPLDDRFSFVHNRIGDAAAEALVNAIIMVTFVVMVVCLSALIWRYRHADGDQRQQMKWLAYGGAVPVLAIGLTLATNSPNLPWEESIGVLPICVGVAILRYRLYDIDTLINGTLVYTALSSVVVGVYVAITSALSVLLEERGGLLQVVVASGTIALLFQPLRALLQRLVNHLLYGQRDEPYTVMAELGKQLEAALSPDALLRMIVVTIRETLKLPYAAITVEQKEGAALLAASGAPSGRAVSLPMVYQQETVGMLLVEPRLGEAALAPADRRLLADLARHAGPAVHTVRLTEDLQRARERLVTAREEERRRLRRDLHDGLGPQLGSQTLTLTAVRKLLRRDPDAAEALLASAMQHSEDAIRDIRRLVYDLRPPALDDLGLVGSLQQVAAHYREHGLPVAIDAAPGDSPLPAAVEVACYRIVQEALANVVRHARARRCRVALRVGDRLELEVQDDGIGLPAEVRAGVGIVSMRERAAELGGQCAVEPLPGGGTIVRAQLPLFGDRKWT
jgi:signal transduction histidine kinase